MKTTLCALIIAIYLLAVQWSADQRRIAEVEKIASDRGRMVAELELIFVKDKLIIDTWTGLDWDRTKPIRKDCKLVTWLDRELCKVYQ